VPKDWIVPPDVDTAEGELAEDETSRMLTRGERRRSFADSDGEIEMDDNWESAEEGSTHRARGQVRDTSGRVVPPAEIAPVPRSR
jgi:hypothetical protein